MTELTTHWSEIHATKNQDVSWWQDSLWLDFLDQVTKSGPAIDVGAGQSPVSIALAENGFNPVYVNDLAENALESLVNEAATKGVNLKKLPGSVLEIEIPETVNLWHDRAVFHFLTDVSDVQKYKSQVLNSLASQGYLVIATFSENGPDQCSGLNVKKYSPTDLAAVFAPEFTLLHGEKRVHLTPWKSEQEFSIVLMQKS